MIRLLLLSLFLVGCGRLYPKTPPSPPVRVTLEEAYATRLAAFREATADKLAGWPSDTDCDGALWAGVARRAGADWVDVAQALQDDGRPTRRPGSDCLEGESAATTSPDMETGIMLGLSAAGDATSLERLFQYGLLHSWVMGTPEYRVDRVLFRPNGISLLARTILRLGGPDHGERELPILYTAGVEDFQAHLLFLSMLLQHDNGDTSFVHETVVQAVCQANPADALGQAVCGNGAAAAALLLAPYESPSYVRGADLNAAAHWLLAAKVALETRT